MLTAHQGHAVPLQQGYGIVVQHIDMDGLQVRAKEADFFQEGDTVAAVALLDGKDMPRRRMQEHLHLQI